MAKPRVTISKSGRLYVIKKGGHEVSYARTKAEAERKAKDIRAGIAKR
jgi:hypothetical protein